MKSGLKKRLIALALFTICICNNSMATPCPAPIDTQATQETKFLLKNLHSIAHQKVLFGHQNTNIYGVNWLNKKEYSDVFEITGSFPSVYGYDFWHLTEGNSENGSFKDYVQWAKWAIQKDSIVTYSWHQGNPVTGKAYYDKKPAVNAILPGGEKHDDFLKELDIIASFFHELAPYPVVFRPYHEHNGDWFWWGKTLCTEKEYIQLFQFTVEYLKDQKGVHNVLYAFSPDRSRWDLEKSGESYFYGYPGDEYVDILGLDNYWDLGHPGNHSSEEVNQENFVSSLEILNSLAEKKGKLAALTETGIENQWDEDWWTNRLLKGIYSSEKTNGISWLLVWRNANKTREKKDHFYVPYKGHPTAPDFVKFRENSHVLFEGDFKGLYQAEFELKK